MSAPLSPEQLRVDKRAQGARGLESNNDIRANGCAAANPACAHAFSPSSSKHASMLLKAPIQDCWIQDCDDHPHSGTDGAREGGENDANGAARVLIVYALGIWMVAMYAKEDDDAEVRRHRAKSAQPSAVCRHAQWRLYIMAAPATTDTIIAITRV